MIVKVYGETAKQIKEGQVFVAKETSVEGRKVMVLENRDIGELELFIETLKKARKEMTNEEKIDIMNSLLESVE